MTIDSIREYQSILVAADFSTSFETALKQGLWLARQSTAKLVLAHAIPDLRQALHMASYQAKIDLLEGKGELIERELRQKSEAKLRGMLDRLDVNDVDIEYRLLLGEAYIEITRLVEEEGFDLVLAGTRGLSSFEQFFVGSTAKRLIRKCPAPVWVVKAEHVGPPSVVLALTDFSAISRKAVLHGWRVAEKAAADFHLMHVIDSRDVPEDLISNLPKGTTLRQGIDEFAQKRFDDFLSALEIDRQRVKLHMTNGIPWKEIQHAVERLDVDLIAMGTVGRGGIKGLLMGNTAERVLDTCDCSILTVKADGFVSPIL